MIVFAALAVLAPLLLADEPKALKVDERDFFHLPRKDDFRLQRIARTGHEAEWPFTVDEGYLTCAFVTGKPTVYFTALPKTGEAGKLRTIIVSTDPFDLAFGNLGGRGLMRKAVSLVDAIKLMAPFESLGSRLCEQPRGTHIRAGEL